MPGRQKHVFYVMSMFLCCYFRTHALYISHFVLQNKKVFFTVIVFTEQNFLVQEN